MKKYHVVMIIARYPPTIGGTELQCRELSNALAKRGHRISVLTEQNESHLPAHETQNGVDLYRFPVSRLPILSTLGFAWHLRRWLKAHPDADLLHAHMLAGPAMTAYFWGKRLRKPVILKIAGAGATGDIGTSQQRWQGHFKLRLFKKWAQLIVCPSQRTFDEIESLGISAKKLRLIPNGVRMYRFKPLPAAERKTLRASLHITELDRMALYVGRWAEGKGLDTLLSVWEDAQDRPDFAWKLILVVSQPPPDAVQARLRNLVTSVEVVIGVVDPLPYYQAADLAVLLSENEGVSNFLLEAMAAGLPLLTSRGAAVSTPEESLTWSWLAPSEKAGILSILRSLQNDTAALKAKGAAARTKAQSVFSTDTVVEKYEQVYAEALI